MGIAILVGFIVYIGLSMLIGYALMAMSPTLNLIMTLLIPFIAGLLAGLIAKGSASRGFTAGFVSVLVGYYLMFLVSMLFILALVSQAGGILPAFTATDVLAWVITLFVVPLVLAVIGGIGGAIMSAAMGGGGGAGSTATSSSTVVNVNSSSEKKEKEKEKVLVCPNCDKENKASATFCAECGTRLRKAKEAKTE